MSDLRSDSIYFDEKINEGTIVCWLTNVRMKLFEMFNQPIFEDFEQIFFWANFLMELLIS